MIYGIIYEYVDILSGFSAYVGKASSLYGFESMARIVQRRHLRGRDPVPFDMRLRERPDNYRFVVLIELVAHSGHVLQRVLKPMEKEYVRGRDPMHNVVRFSS